MDEHQQDEGAPEVAEQPAEQSPVSEATPSSAKPTSEPAAEAAEAAAEGATAQASEGQTSEGEGTEEAAEGAEPDPSAPPDPRKWFAVHTYSGHENKARLSLLERVRTSSLEEQFGEILIPTESVVEIRGGKKRTTTRKFYPGYMFVQMELNDLTFHLVKNTPKITGFLGGTKPTPVKDHEIKGISKQMTEGAIKPKPRIIFEEGDAVRVTEGPFSNFNGTILEVRPEKQKVRVQVSIFGRGTPVELDFGQVEKA